jgi:hypothetical protein
MDSEIEFIVKNLNYHTSINDNSSKMNIKQYLGYNLPLKSNATFGNMINYHTSIEQKSIIDRVKEQIIHRSF